MVRIRLPVQEMQETRVQSLSQKDPLEKGTAIHSSILAQEILLTEEPGRLQSMGLLRVRHNWATECVCTHHTHTHTHTHGGIIASSFLGSLGEITLGDDLNKYKNKKKVSLHYSPQDKKTAKLMNKMTFITVNKI